MLNVKTTNTVQGIASIAVGSKETRATNQDWRKNSRSAKGRRGTNIKVSAAITKNAPMPRAGFHTGAVIDDVMVKLIVARQSLSTYRCYFSDAAALNCSRVSTW
jgi:hypothetical protein